MQVEGTWSPDVGVLWSFPAGNIGVPNALGLFSPVNGEQCKKITLA